jgi:phosphoglycolate phosphatase-like HAD superfamily hydrolase
MKKFRAALFDWDVTLFDSQHLNYLSAVEIFRTFNLTPPTEEEYCAKISADYMPFYWSYGIPRGIDKEELNEIRKEFMRMKSFNIRLFPDTFPTLFYFKSCGFKVGIISAEDSELLSRRIKFFSLGKLLHYSVGDATDKKMYIWDALETFGMEPEECFFVDDSPRDLITIKDAGVFTVGITRGIRTREALALGNPDLIVDCLDEILHLSEVEE